MSRRPRGLMLGLAILIASPLPATRAEPPVAVYAFPAGGQRGTEVPVRIGGLFFHGEADFAITGSGLHADKIVREIPRIWFEGPMIHQPASQRGEDYPRDHAATIRIDQAAPVGTRRWHCRTAQGGTPALPFLVGDLPEVVEQEVEGEPMPVSVNIPATVNGRIFPRQDRDIWEIEAAAGEWITGEVVGRRLGYPIEPSIAVTGVSGRPVSADTVIVSGDPRFAFRAPEAGRYRIEVSDGNFSGGQHFIYRLTLRRGPAATSVFPLGGRGGSPLELEFTGPALSQAVRQTITLAAGSGPWQPVSHDPGSYFPLQVGDDPEVIETPGTAQALPIPGVANGRILTAGETDEWILDLKKDQTMRLEVRAASLGSRLDSRLVLTDGNGAELTRNDDAAPGNPDSLIAFTAKKDGLHRVVIGDRFASRSGPDFAYRLTARLQDTLDFGLVATGDALTIVRDAVATPAPVDPKAPVPKKPRVRGTGITVNLEPYGGFKSDVILDVEGLPPGVTLDESTRKIAFSRKTTELFLDAAPDCPVQSGELRLRGTAEVDGQKIVREVALPFRVGEPRGDGVRFAIAPAVPFSFTGDYWVETGYPVGSRLTKTYRLDRGGFTGPLTVSLSDRQIRHLQGVTAEPVTIPPDADQFTYTVTLPPRMEMGRTCRVQLMISGEITDADGRRHRVSYTNASPEQQMMSIVSEGRLHLITRSTSIRVVPGQSSRVPVTIQRDPSLASLPLIVDLVIPPSAAGITATSVELPPGTDSAEVEIRFADQPGPFLLPIKLRARTVATAPSSQHEAEVELELVAIDPG